MSSRLEDRLSSYRIQEVGGGGTWYVVHRVLLAAAVPSRQVIQIVDHGSRRLLTCTASELSVILASAAL
jgi:hypothetical protein